MGGGKDVCVCVHVCEAGRGKGGEGGLTWETQLTINLLECVVSMSTSESKIFQKTLCSTAAPGLHVQMEPRCKYAVDSHMGTFVCV